MIQVCGNCRSLFVCLFVCLSTVVPCQSDCMTEATITIVF